MLNLASKMSKLANFAYLDAKSASPRFKELGYTGSRFFENDGAQCYAVWNKTHYVLCFRGTEPSEMGDVLADLNAIPRGAMTHGLVHSGFRGELDKLWEQVVDHREKHKNKVFYITGHSLGAAMATIATSRFEEFCNVDSLFTFGSPRVGTRRFIDALVTPHYRFVNNNDIVTSVPFAWMGYRHHGNLTYINYYGNIRNLTPWQRIKDKFRGRMRALKKGQPFDGAFDHSMTLYVKKIENNTEEV